MLAHLIFVLLPFAAPSSAAAPVALPRLEGTVAQFWALKSGEPYVLLQTAPRVQTAMTMRRGETYRLTTRLDSQDAILTGVLVDSWRLRDGDVYLIMGAGRKQTALSMSQVSAVAAASQRGFDAFVRSPEFDGSGR